MGSCAFARHYLRNHLIVFSSSRYLDVSVPWVCSFPCGRFPTFSWEGCPIRISTDHELFALPRSFSQLITSFFASESLGIPHTPLFTSFTTFSCRSIAAPTGTHLCARSVEIRSRVTPRPLSPLFYFSLFYYFFHHHVNELLRQPFFPMSVTPCGKQVRPALRSRHRDKPNNLCVVLLPFTLSI